MSETVETPIQKGGERPPKRPQSEGRANGKGRSNGANRKHSTQRRSAGYAAKPSTKKGQHRTQKVSESGVHIDATAQNQAQRSERSNMSHQKKTHGAHTVQSNSAVQIAKHDLKSDSKKDTAAKSNHSKMQSRNKHELRGESMKRQKKHRGRRYDSVVVAETYEDLLHENERLLKEIVLEIADIRTISLD